MKAAKIFVILSIIVCLSLASCETSESKDFSSTLINDLGVIDDNHKEMFNPFNNESKYSFWHSLISGFSLIFISEIGDSTFILAIFFTVKIGAVLSFICSASVLVTLNVVWLLIGAALPILIYKNLLNWFAVIVFLILAIVLLVEGLKMEDKKIIEEFNELVEEKKKEEQEEDDKAELLIEKNDEETNLVENKEKDKPLITKKTKAPEKLSSTAWGFCLSLLLAECGDRSQITALTIAAVYDFKGVLIGSSLGHITACLIAVTIGHYFSERISEKWLTLVGSALFFVYAADFFIFGIWLD